MVSLYKVGRCLSSLLAAGQPELRRTQLTRSSRRQSKALQVVGLQPNVTEHSYDGRVG